MIDYMSSKPLQVIWTGMKIRMLIFGISNVISWASIDYACNPAYKSNYEYSTYNKTRTT